MTSTANEIALPGEPGAAARTASFIGQATAVEQARAVAEVQAAIVVAQQCPRSMARAVEQMRESCAQMGLAERAFFRYNRSGKPVTGATVHLARELARCFGNMQYGIAELRRDDRAGESEMTAFGWDVQNNTRASTTFIVKHGRDTTSDGVKALTALRDIYENNANMGARRLREQIFAILPRWFTEEASDLCRATIEKGTSDKPLAQQRADAVKAFSKFGVTVAQLEEKVARRSDDWTGPDLAQLGVIFKSLDRGEITVEEEFPKQRVTAAEITNNHRPAAGAQSGAASGAESGFGSQSASDAAGGDEPGITKAQLTKLHTVLTKVGYTDRDKALDYYARVTGRRVESSKDLTKAEAVRVIDSLENLDGADPATGEVTEPGPDDGPSQQELDAMAAEMT